MDHQPLQTPQACQLKCNDPQIINWYNLALETQLHEVQVFEKLSTLHQEIQGNQITRCQSCEFENIDHMVTGTKLVAE